ncbi:MAG TPA: trypsin-like peptidase domain-containing protein [Thermoanaerobaculia bacterium]|jgi:S1-C subfamily serine protease
MKVPAVLALSFLLASPLTAQRSAEEETVIRVARTVSPAVVSVSRSGGSGSGVIIRAEGIIVTNAHVVGNARRVEVRTADGRTFAGDVLGRDETVDIAVVRINARNLPAAPIANSDRLEVGQLAIAIGNPLGLERTVTRGVVSAVNRSPGNIGISAGLIQTDAAINPGNSGGPLLDSSGRVIGINTVILAGATGLGFAVPINLAIDVVDQLLATGRVSRAFLGIGYGDLDREIARYYDLPVEQGVIVSSIVRNSPAARAGFREADIITSIGGEAVTNSGDLGRILRSRRPGDSVAVEFYRGNQRQRVNVTLTER